MADADADDDSTLLTQYVRGRSEPVFRRLVTRHVNLVYSAALRQVRDPHLAEDVTQGVFIVLARRAHTIRSEAALAGWLLSTTRYVASTAIRAQARRRRHEQRAASMNPEPLAKPAALAAGDLDSTETWQEMEPHVDAAIAALASADRTAIALRFFDQKSLAQVAAAMGTTEEAARKRVARALEKMRKFLTRRGVTTPAAAAGIAAALTAGGAAHAAPPVLAESAATAALSATAASASAASSLAGGAVHMMALAKLKAAAIVLLACALPISAAAVVAVPRLRAATAATRPNTPAGSFTFLSRLVDGQGKPVAGATVGYDASVDDRRERSTVTSDANGEFTVTNRLNPKLLISVEKPGYRSIGHKEVESSPDRQTIAFQRDLTIRGTVVDARTGERVRDFRAYSGGAWTPEQKWVDRDKSFANADGTFAVPFPWMYPQVWVYVEAPRYAPQQSKVYSTEEGELTVDLKLEPARNLAGVVTTESGEPVAGAEIHVLEANGLINLDGSVRRPSRAPTSQRARERASSGTDGRFEVPPPAGPAAIVVVHESGIARVPDAATLVGAGAGAAGGGAGAKIALEPWATVEGVVAESLRTKQPQMVTAWSDNYVGPGRLAYRQSTKIGADGKFRFENVPPGELSVGIEEKFERARSLTTLLDHLVRLEATAGQRSEAKVGGSGEGVTGAVALPAGVSGDLESRFVFAQLRGLPVPNELLPRPDVPIKTPQEFEAWLKQFRQTPDGKKFAAAEAASWHSYAVRIGADGKLEVKDVLPGRYLLVVEVYELNHGPAYGYGKPVASARKTVQVVETGDKCDVGVTVLEAPAPPATRPSPAQPGT